jgi:hypothetical protein
VVPVAVAAHAVHALADVAPAGEYCAVLLHNVTAPLPVGQYVPGGHWVTLPDVDPGGHTNPAVQLPAQVALGSPATVLHLPAAQGVHARAPAREYRPAGHSTAVEFVDPRGQAYPAVHDPEQALVVRPVVVGRPNLPAGQPVHADAPLLL